MSDDEMNIDDGTFPSISFFVTMSLFSPQVANGGGPIRKRGRGFQGPAGLYLPCAL